MSIPGRYPATLFGAVLQLGGRRPVFTAALYAIDGVSGKVASFLDWNDFTHLLVQASAPLQVAIPATHADFAGNLCAMFTGTEYYLSNRPTVYWAYSADGTGFEVIACARPTSLLSTGAIFGTLATVNTQGFFLYRSTNTPRALVSKAGTLVVNIFNISAATLTVNTPYVFGFAHQAAAPVNGRGQLGSNTPVSISYLAPPVAGATAYPLSLGAGGDGLQGWVGQWAFGAFNAQVDPTWRDLVATYLRSALGQNV
jgi:hypothetical protein